jgi:hypothetical protein
LKKKNGDNMYELKVDIDKNRLFLKLDGFFHDDELVNTVNDVKRAINSLKPNFDVINDISGFRPATPEGRDLMMGAMKYVIEHKVNRVVRVVENVTGSMQFSRASKEMGYTAVHVKSYKEALEYLERN